MRAGLGRVRRAAGGPLGHDDVADDVEAVAPAHGFEGVLEAGAGVWGVEVRPAVVAGEGHEVEVLVAWVSDEALRHGWRVRGVGGCGSVLLVPSFSFVEVGEC